MITPPHPGLFWIIGGLFATLVVGTMIRFIALRKAEEALRRKRLISKSLRLFSKPLKRFNQHRVSTWRWRRMPGSRGWPRRWPVRVSPRRRRWRSTTEGQGR